MVRGRAQRPERVKQPKAPVTVTRMKLVTCAVCRRNLDATTKSANEALTEHYNEQHQDLVLQQAG